LVLKYIDMLRKITLLALFALPILATAQIKILETSSSTTNSDGEVFDVSGNPASVEFVKYLYVVNEGNSDLVLKVRRTELDVQVGTENATCWKVCPAAIAAGTEVVQISQFSETITPGDTNATFSAHHYLEGLDGCSMYLYEWVDASNLNTVYGSVTIKFLHNTSTSCNVGVEEDNVSFEMYPNPADAEVNFTIDGANGELEYEVLNLLGQKEVSVQLGSASGSIVKVNTSNLSNGVYFVAVKSNGKVIKTEKLVVKH
jgi:hypothetical protein